MDDIKKRVGEAVDAWFVGDVVNYAFAKETVAHNALFDAKERLKEKLNAVVTASTEE